MAARTTYLHSQGTVGFDWRTSPGYSRRGGFYGVTVHDYTDRDEAFGFRQVDYEAIQHFPILRETWVISLRGLRRDHVRQGRSADPVLHAAVARRRIDLRGFTSWRFRDRNSLLLQAEWRIMVNRFLDTAVFYDAGKVTARTADLDLDGLKNDFGFGVRFHGPFATPLRVEVAKSNEGLVLVSSARLPRSEVCCMSRSLFPRLPRRARLTLLAAVACAALAPTSLDAAPRFYRDDPIAREPESQDASQAQPYDIESTVRDDLQPVRHVGSQAVRQRARRTSTRSTRCRTRAGSRTGSATTPITPERDRRAAPNVGRAARPVALDAHPGENRRRASRLHGEGRQGRDLVPASSIRRTTPKARPARSRSRRRSSGRSATTRSNRS